MYVDVNNALAEGASRKLCRKSQYHVTWKGSCECLHCSDRICSGVSLGFECNSSVDIYRENVLPASHGDCWLNVKLSACCRLAQEISRIRFCRFHWKTTCAITKGLYRKKLIKAVLPLLTVISHRFETVESPPAHSSQVCHSV